MSNENTISSSSNRSAVGFAHRAHMMNHRFLIGIPPIWQTLSPSLHTNPHHRTIVRCPTHLAKHSPWCQFSRQKQNICQSSCLRLFWGEGDWKPTQTMWPHSCDHIGSPLGQRRSCAQCRHLRARGLSTTHPAHTKTTRRTSVRLVAAKLSGQFRSRRADMFSVRASAAFLATNMPNCVYLFECVLVCHGFVVEIHSLLRLRDVHIWQVGWGSTDPNKLMEERRLSRKNTDTTYS